MMWTVVKKELRGYFNSAIAVIFLAVFLAFSLTMFFWLEKFFARGLADLRPLFKWMPVALIILASALSMRLWADERRAGTLEVLLTLPVPRWQLVLGKFIAGMLLIAVALALTFGLPITIARMGNLDVGPVVGGYLATLLLSAAYLAIGMCVSAATDNQIIAFIGTAALCGVTWAIGLFNWKVGQLLGTGVRFESVARGVLDLRDLAYYAGIVCVGIALNVVLLQRLTWGRGARGRARRVAALLGVTLVAANAIVLDLWLAPVRRARIDLTEGGTYSLSDSTHKILAGLDERLLIRGYFSERTHPKLAPLVPELRDLLEEYRIAGAGKVRVEIIDPSEPEDASSDSEASRRATEAMREAKERFGIDPTPFRFATQTEHSIVNGYFAIAIEYGDQHAVLGFRELITERAVDMDRVEIMLKNPEYELTKSIKKTVSEFSSVDALFSSTPGKIQLTAYITPDVLPENLKDAPDKLKKVADELVKQSGGKLVYNVVEPKTDDEKRELFNKHRLRAYPLDLFGTQGFYFHIMLQVGDRPAQRITLPPNFGDAEIKTALTEGLKRAAPGFTRVVGLWMPPTPPPQPGMHGMPPQQMPPPQSFRTLRQALSGNYEVREVVLTAPVPDEIEALVLAGPANLDAKAAEYVDQFVMRGGALVALAGRNRLSLSGGGLAIEKVTTGLESVFQKWGITVAEDMVMDTKSDALPMPENRDLGNGMIVRQFRKLAYPFFVSVDGDQVSSSSVITSSLAGSVLHWVSPVKAETKVGDDQHQVDVLLTSSTESWLTSSSVVEPDLRTYPKLGFPGPGEAPADKKGSQVLAVAITGGFTSSVAKPEKPEDRNDKDAAAPPLLEHSPPDARIVVFGSSAFASDDLLALADQIDSDFAKTNLQLVQNAVDWTLADTELLAIRSRTMATRALTVGTDSRAAWIWANGAIAVAGLVLVVVLAWLRRRAVLPLTTKEA